MAKNRTETDLTPRERSLANLKTDAGPGRPKGRRNFSTIFYDALEKLAEKNGMEPDQLETEIVEKALLTARKGDHRFYKDLMDRLHGTATQVVESTIKVTDDTITPEEKESLLALLNK